MLFRWLATLVLFTTVAFAQTRAPELAIVDAYFEDYDRAIVRQLQVPAGDTVYLTFRIAGFRLKDEKQVRLSYWIDCLDPGKTPVAETLSEKVEQTLSPQDEKWRPRVNWSLVIPSYAPGGEYSVAIRVRDEIAGREARHHMTFRVRGETPDPETLLGVAGFEFADSEDGKAKDPPAYAPGSQLWARFRIVGIQAAPDKRIFVEQDLTVLDAEGKEMYSKPQGLVENQRYFYPPRFLTAAFSLELQPKLRAGEYTIRIALRDLIAQKTARFETRFTVAP